MVYFMENPKITWMMDDDGWGTPISGKLHRHPQKDPSTFSFLGSVWGIFYYHLGG